VDRSKKGRTKEEAEEELSSAKEKSRELQGIFITGSAVSLPSRKENAGEALIRPPKCQGGGSAGEGSL